MLCPLMPWSDVSKGGHRQGFISSGSAVLLPPDWNLEHHLGLRSFLALFDYFFIIIFWLLTWLDSYRYDDDEGDKFEGEIPGGIFTGHYEMEFPEGSPKFNNDMT